MSRRTRWTAIGCSIVMTALTVATFSSGASAATDPGQGAAIAQTQKIDPKAGGLSLGFTFGQSLAGHQNQVAQASSQAINMGIIGTTLASEGCDGSDPTVPADQQPQALRIDSRDPGADKGKTETENGAFTKEVRADGTPLGEATTTTAGYGIAGVLTMGSGVSRTHSGVVDGVREAVATVDIGSVDFAGQVHLGGLHWNATYRSSGDNKVTGTFSIGSATIAGQALPTNDPSAVLDQANAVLNKLGLKLVAPTAKTSGGVLFVSPLTIAVVPNAQRDALAGAVIGGIQPIRKALVDALLAQSCKNASYVTIFDLVVGSVTGAGEFNLSLGGVQASSSEIPKNAFSLGEAQYTLGGAGGGNGSFDLPGDTGRTGDTSSSYTGTAPESSTGGGSGGDGGKASGPKRLVTQPASALAGKRGGGLAVAGLASLGLLAALAEGDRRKMRRAQREIPET